MTDRPTFKFVVAVVVALLVVLVLVNGLYYDPIRHHHQHPRFVFLASISIWILSGLPWWHCVTADRLGELLLVFLVLKFFVERYGRQRQLVLLVLPHNLVRPDPVHYNLMEYLNQTKH